MKTSKNRLLVSYIFNGLMLLAVFAMLVYAQAQRTVASHQTSLAIKTSQRADSAVAVAEWCVAQAESQEELVRQAWEEALRMNLEAKQGRSKGATSRDQEPE